MPQLSVLIPEDLYKEIERRSDKSGKLKSHIVRELLKCALGQPIKNIDEDALRDAITRHVAEYHKNDTQHAFVPAQMPPTDKPKTDATTPKIKRTPIPLAENVTARNRVFELARAGLNPPAIAKDPGAGGYSRKTIHLFLKKHRSDYLEKTGP